MNPACSKADGAAHDHQGDDEQRDLEEHYETGSSSEGRHGPRLFCLGYELALLWVVTGPRLRAVHILLLAERSYL
jgi:hypothetical protein